MDLFSNTIFNSFTFYDKDGEVIKDVSHIKLTPSGELDDIIVYNSENNSYAEISHENYSYTNLLLVVPGLGYAYCGDEIVLEQYRKHPKTYKLMFGWHTNVSNQKIFSWYLDDYNGEIKTLYYDDVCNIIAINHIVGGVVVIDSRYTSTPITNIKTNDKHKIGMTNVDTNNISEVDTNE